MLWPLLILHICTAVVGLLSGFLAMSLRKGSGWHGAAGSVFFVSMLIMSASGAWIAAFLKPNMLNVVAALLTFYLVATAWWTARRRDEKTGLFDLVALLFILGVGALGVTSGFEAASSLKGTKDGMPAAIYFVFGSIAFLCAASDIRMLVQGAPVGVRRIARHLLRMCSALLIATLSFYPGQARQFPEWLRETNLLFVPHVFLAGSMIFWMVRMRSRKQVRQDMVITRDQGVAIIRSAAGAGGSL